MVAGMGSNKGLGVSVGYRLGPNLNHKDKPNPNFDPIIFTGLFFYLLYPSAVFSSLAQTKCLQYQYW